MKILGIEHIAIAVKNLDKSALFWKRILNISHVSNEVVSDQGVNLDIYDTGKGKVELLEELYPDSPITRFLQKNGTGIHHVCFEVDNIDNAINELRDNNIQLIGEDYTIGAEGYKVIFIHPKSADGVLVELAENPDNI